MNGWSNLYLLLADITLLLHAGFVVFVIVGQILIFVGWAKHWQWVRNPWFRYFHFAAIVMVMLEAWFGVPCPLTLLENSLRVSAGDMAYHTSFISYWLSRVLFYTAPGWVFTLIYCVFGGIVLLTLYFHPPQWRANGNK